MGAKATRSPPCAAAQAPQPNCAAHNVIKVNLDSDGKRAVGSRTMRVDARWSSPRLVILTSYTFNNVRLMLLSGIGKPYDPVSNRGVVGRNYAYVTYGKVALFFDDKVFNPFMGGGGLATAIDEFNGDNFDHTNLGFIGGAYHIVSSVGAPPIKSHPVPPGTPRWGAGWKQAVAQYYNRSFQIIAHGSCQSYRTNIRSRPTYRDANACADTPDLDRRENEFKMSPYHRQGGGNREGHRSLENECQSRHRKVHYRGLSEHA